MTDKNLRTVKRSALALVSLILSGSTAIAADQQREPAYGVWLNPHGTVKVETRSCGQSLCGTIVWAAPKAQGDATRAGVDRLIGLQLLSGYKPKRRGLWEGQVYVPDLQHSFFSRLQAVAPDRLKISGCVIGGLICKSQVWTRV